MRAHETVETVELLMIIAVTANCDEAGKEIV
jgi:hypothetical protein